MLLVAITPEITLPDEPRRIAMLLDAGFDAIHIRKPGISDDDMRRYVEKLPPRLLPGITLGDCLHLAQEYDAGGVHLNSRCPSAPESFKGRVSRSCHCREEVMEAAAMSYVFLSPIFDSISKQGYKAAFPLQQLRMIALEAPVAVVGLGGVTARNMPLLREAGLSGAAFLGYLFATDIEQMKQRIKLITNNI